MPIHGATNREAFDPVDFELVQDGRRIVSLTFTISLYTNVPFTTIPDAILDPFNLFLGLCPADQLSFYATETSRKHKKVTKRSLNMLETWLSPSAPAREYVALEINNAELYNSCPDWKFEVYGGEVGSVAYMEKDANLLSLSFPAAWARERVDEILDLSKRLCEIFPFQSGHAGYCFLASRYDKTESQTFAWAKSMRHRGIDIFHFNLDKCVAGQDAAKGVGWLTMLCNEFVEELGGVEKLKGALADDVEVIATPTGVFMKAGPKPKLGDTNRQEFLAPYRSVYGVVEPLVEKGIDRAPALSLETDYVEKTEAWLRRFADD